MFREVDESQNFNSSSLFVAQSYGPSREANTMPNDPPAKSQRREAIAVMLHSAAGHIRTLEEIKADVIRTAVVACKGNITEVAYRLGISRTTVYSKLEAPISPG